MAVTTILDQTQEAAPPNNSSSTSIKYLLQIASFFRDPENRDKIYGYDLTYERFDQQLREIFSKSGLKAENFTFEQLLELLEDLEGTEINPKNLILTPDQLEKMKKEAQELEAQIKDINQRANQLKEELIKKLTKAPVPQKLKTQVATELNFALNQNLARTELIFLIGKLEGMPLDQRAELENEISQKFSKIWYQTVEDIKDPFLRSSDYLKRLDEPVLHVVGPDKNLLKINQFTEEVSKRIDTILAPVVTDKDYREKISSQVAENIVQNHVLKGETVVYSSLQQQEKETRDKINTALTEELKKQGASAEAIEKLQLADAVSPKVSEVAYFLEKIGEVHLEQARKIETLLTPLTPEKAAEVADRFIKNYADNLSQIPSVSPMPKEIEAATIAAVWQMVGSGINGNEIKLTSKETSQILAILSGSQTELFPRFRSLSNLPQAETNPLLLKESDGQEIFKKVKEQLLNFGVNINPQSSEQLTLLKYQLQAIELYQKGVTQEQLQATLEELRNSGLAENSQQVKEISMVIKAYQEISTKINQSPALKQEIKENQSKFNKPVQSVRMFLSNTVIKVKKETVQLTSKIVKGNKLINLFTKINQAVIFPIANFFTKIKIKLGFSKTVQSKSQLLLQKIFTFFASKRIFSPVTGGVRIPPFVVQTGKQSLTAVTERVFSPRMIRNIGEGFASLLSGQNRTMNSITNAAQTLLSGFSNPANYVKGVGKSINIGMIAIVAILAIVIFSTGGAITSQAGPPENEEIEGLNEPGFVNPGLPPQCEDDRHYAEKVICVLKECGITQVTLLNIEATKNCIQKSSLQGKSVLEQEISRLYGGILQCIGFVDAIQKALGLSMGNRRNACQYIDYAPSGYSYISGTGKPEVGDVAIWNESKCGGSEKDTAAPWGHIAIVIEVKGDVKIVVAEANGINGILRIVEYSYGQPGNLTDPTKFLRPN